jgi:hypothetical protein
MYLWSKIRITNFYYTVAGPLGAVIFPFPILSFIAFEWRVVMGKGEEHIFTCSCDGFFFFLTFYVIIRECRVQFYFFFKVFVQF